jgi:hypothetical protein
VKIKTDTANKTEITTRQKLKTEIKNDIANLRLKNYIANLKLKTEIKN